MRVSERDSAPAVRGMLCGDAPGVRVGDEAIGEEHMTIGDVFARAWDLWRRDVGWLILAGLVVGIIMAVIFAIAFGIFGAIFAGAGLTIGADLASDTTSGLTGLGIGMIIFGIIAYAVLMFVVQVVGMTFYGGMFEMVIGAYRGSRGVQFGDLFSGFRKFGAYAVFALVMFGVSFGLNIVNVVPFVGWIVSFVVSIWIAVIWLYVLPLIADQGIGFGEAASRSNQMVKSAGWWWTLGMVILLGIAAAVFVAVIVAVSAGIYQGSETGGILFGLLLFLVFAVLFPPYAICYISVLYIASGGDLAPAAAPTGVPQGVPPAPPAPPSYSAGSYSGPSAPFTPGHPAGDDAWRAAADPLAGQPPAPPLSPPTAASAASAAQAEPASASQPETGPATGAAETGVDDGQTAVTGAVGDEPEPPVPPAPPAPPAPSPPGGTV